MRTFLLSLVSVSLWAASPCIKADRSCTEWIPLGGGPARSLVYRTYSMDARNESITRALVIVHGASRDADNYFRTGLAAAFLAGALENTVVVAPRFASSAGGCADKLDAILKGHVSKDHVHLLVSIPPQTTISRLMQWLKGRTAHHLLAEFPHLKKQFRG